MRLRSAVAACVLLHAERVLCAPITKAAQNSTSDTFIMVVGAIFGCFLLFVVCAWLNGMITCKEVQQCLT